MTFSFDLGPDQMIPDFGSPQVGKSPKSQMLPATDCSRFNEKG
ncbi:hypothetical protein [Bradyrhizobium sp. AUGA SZCCT0283]|jgi:hypothetical protein|nr:hypothetical protein [Bradyrhizobium sp. AUGA SZCCT0283]